MEFPITTSITVRYRDLDPLGHVNNAVYASYLEWARVAFRQALAKATGQRLSPLASAREFGYVIAELTIVYRSPAYLAEILDIGIKVASAGRTSFVFEYAVTERESGRLVATGRTVQVMVNPQTGDKVPVSDSYLAAVARLQGAPVPRSAYPRP
jgi:acyl-CoA thioester hydrolase